MDTPRTAYKVNAANPGSDVAGETAAALAAASMAFRTADGVYAGRLIASAKQVSTVKHFTSCVVLQLMPT